MKIKRETKNTTQVAAGFRSLADEAAYWDTHSVLDGITEASVVGVHRGQKADTLTVRFSQDDLTKLRQEASHKGIGPSTLVRMWVKEHLGG